MPNITSSPFHRIECCCVVTIEQNALRMSIMSQDGKVMYAVSSSLFYRVRDFSPSSQDIFQELQRQIRYEVANLKKQIPLRCTIASVYICLNTSLAGGRHQIYGFQRDRAKDSIDAGEASHILHTVYTKAYEDARLYFVAKTKMAKTEMALLNTFTSGVRVDGVSYQKLSSQKGKIVDVGLFILFAPKVYTHLFSFFEDLLGCKAEFFYKPLLYADWVQASIDKVSDTVVLSVDEYLSSLYISNQRTTVYGKEVQGGYTQMLKCLRKRFVCEEEDLYTVLRYYDQGMLSDSTRDVMEDVLLESLLPYWQRIENILRMYAVKKFIPSTIYIHSRQDLFFLLCGIIKKRAWKNRFSFQQDLTYAWAPEGLAHKVDDSAFLVQNMSVNDSRLFVLCQYLIVEAIAHHHRSPYLSLYGDLQKITNLIR